MMNRHLLLPFTLLLASLATRAPAQVVYVFDSFGSATANESYLPSTSYPSGAQGFGGGISLPMSAVLTGGPVGGIAIDQASSRIFCSDGTTITTDDHSRYLPFSGPGAAVPPAPAPVLLGGGPITGLGADGGGVLWVSDATSYAGLTLGFPFATVVAPALFPFSLPAGASVQGIDHDGADGTLWAVDSQGNVYHWTPGGAAIGSQPVGSATSPFFGAFVGIAVNESNGAGALTPHFCSTQAPGYHVVVTDGVAVYDPLDPTNPAIPVSNSITFIGRGMAYANDMQYSAGEGLFSPILVGIPGWSKPQNKGPGGANALRLVGAQPMTTALFLYDNCPIPGGLSVPASLETLWLNPLSPTFGFAPFVTDAAGEIAFPIDLTLAPAGFNLVGQWALYSPASPLGYALTHALRFVIGTN